MVRRCGAGGDGGVAAGFASVDTAFAGCFEKADDSDGMLGDAMYMAIDLLEEAVMENVTKRLINFLDKCLDDSRYFEYSEAGNKIYQIRARIWRLAAANGRRWQDYVAKRLAVAKLELGL